MAESRGRGSHGGIGARLRYFWQLVMGDGASGASGEADDHSVTGNLGVRIRWFLGLGLMRATVPLRTVIKSGEPIHVRARLESAKIKEQYYYHQQISLNPSIEERKDPEGKVKLVLPFDGEKYFTRQAYRDVERARRHGADRDSKAQVGFLAFTRYEGTDLGRVLNLDENHGSFPIEVDLPDAPRPRKPDPLLADNSASIVSGVYRPARRAAQITPVHLDIGIHDPDTGGITEVPEIIPEGLDISMMRQVDFEPVLSLWIIVNLYLPNELVDGAHATVSKVFIGWPTRTSLRSLRLNVNDEQHQLRYNPERADGGLEWRGVPMTAQPKREGGDIRVLSSEPMILSIPTPGDLYRQDTLDGEVEVTVNRLLSRTNARLFDSAGKRCRYPEPQLKSVISTTFSLTLDDAFSRRVCSPYQQMHFDEVVLNRARIDDIETALKNRGFTVRVLRKDDHAVANSRRSGDPDGWWLIAERVHGADRLRLLLYLAGKNYLTQRERQVQGGMAYKTTIGSGEFQVYAYGFLPRESKAIVQEMNALRHSLRERFDRLPAGR